MSDQPLSLPELLAATPVPPGAEAYPCQIGVYCDDCGLLELHDYVAHTGMTRDERLDAARKYLTEHKGWDCGTAGDLCPDCKADEPGMCPACDTAAIERCEACGKCRCDTHESCARPITKCPGVGEYGHGLTGKTVHLGCCPASR
ncbi:hypothetical protein [Streptomyces sp. NPDC057325]|uniref:hypothetical protein n=1 Tax=unclassified Streptomyces TaxID=2593676 RepID=UPI003645A994